ncbi:MAG: carboxypeptidase-like regulatory domain-containing protein [Saprospiraceae bacterium]|nr:carboxypeptidase-like regulatory domain-containing protein [Saprospiraceae bacterium]
MKFDKRAFSLIIICFFGALGSIVAQASITGTVNDKTNGDPLIGAAVSIKGTTIGTVTDFDGQFILKTDTKPPFTLTINYIGYNSQEFEVSDASERIRIRLEEQSVTIDVVEVTGQRISEKQKAAPLTVESMDLLAIKQTPSDNFYDGLGSLKGVDLTAASLGFKIINTRGFNSTSPVRSLQIIDGIDNQAPGLNFSLGNFLGSSELDVVKVDLIQGASSAFYGPNAFNGVISMETKNPFVHRGLAVMLKGGERNMFEGAIRYADITRNRDSLPVFAYKLNFSYLRADDWVADNYDPVFGTETGTTNPGRYDAVNIYGDEYSRNMDLTGAAPWEFVGLGQWHRTGYKEIDLVDYGTRNYKANVAFHFRTAPKKQEESPEVIISSSLGSGTTVYQGDNRFSLRNILFMQHRIEYRKTDKFFFRVYATQDDAGDSYDPYFTALKLQQRAKSNVEWATSYVNYWRNNIEQKIDDQGYPQLQISFDPDGNPIITFDYEGAQQWLQDNNDSLTVWHIRAEEIANKGGSTNLPFFEPGTPEFEKAFQEIISAKSNDEEGGTKFYDKSALYHAHGEYRFTPGFVNEWVVGANTRLYTPVSDGTIFYDTAGVVIRNFEFGVYTGMQKKFWDERLTANATVRLDKNQNFDYLASPAASIVFKPRPNNYFRLSFSSAIRNPTLTDQYLNLNVGPATLAGNLNGVDSLITINSFLDYIDTQLRDTLEYFNIDPIRPEKVKTFEVGYRTTLFNRLYVDAGYYFNIYNDFIGYRLGIESGFNEFGFPVGTIVYRYSGNSTEQVTTQGFSIGFNLYFSNYYSFSGNYSWNKLNKAFPDDPIIPAFNTPEHKFNIGISGRDIVWQFGERSLRNFGFNVNYKWIEGFIFEGSPQFTGFVPSYGLLDGQINFNVKKWDTTFKFGASNILNNKQFQAYGGPRIGRLAYASIVYDFRKF